MTTVMVNALLRETDHINSNVVGLRGTEPVPPPEMPPPVARLMHTNAPGHP